MIGICVALGLDKDVILEKYSENYWDLLNPKLANGKGLYRNALISKIERANKEFKEFYIKKYQKVIHVSSKIL